MLAPAPTNGLQEPLTNGPQEPQIKISLIQEGLD